MTVKVQKKRALSCGTVALPASSAMMTFAAAVLVATCSGLKSDSTLFIGPFTFLPSAPGFGTRTRQHSSSAIGDFEAARVQQSRWCARSRVRGRQGQRLGSSSVLRMGASSDQGDDEAGDSGDANDDGVDWGKINPKPGQEPDWDNILPKGRLDTPELPPAPPDLSELDPRERLAAYAGMLDWEPLDLNKEEEKEKTYDDLNQEMGDEWLAGKLQSALLKNRNKDVQTNANKALISDWLDEEKEKLEGTAEDLKEAYRRDAERIKNQMMEEFDKEARVMDIKIKNIIERGKSNFTQFTGPLTDQTPFPAAVAAEFAYLAEDEAAFYEELGGGGGLGGLFGGGGGGGGDAAKGGGLSDEEVVALIEACGKELKHIVCLSVGGAAGGGSGGGGLFGGGGGGAEDKGFPGESMAEQGVIRVAKAKGLSFTTVRVSSLGGDGRGAIEPLPLITPKNTPRADGGRSTLPQASRSVVANTLFRASYQPEARRNSTLAVSDFPESWPVPASGWGDEFLKLTGPELLRIPIPATFDGMSEGSGTFRAWAFLREWAQSWKEEGTGLTTPVKVFADEEARRTGLYFDPSQTQYLSAKEEREAEEQRKAKANSRGESGPPSKMRGLLKKEGGLDIIVEDRPYPRVRVVRANMGPKTVVKEMSEQLILDRLKKDVKAWIITQPKP
ncbi:unnamed protein product [Pylaiella littoralis]